MSTGSILLAELSALFLLGFLGSGHCIGMCGPIAVAVCSRGATARLGGSSILYNIGRVLTYSLIGAVLGAVGSGLSDLGQLVRLQVWLTLASSLWMGWLALAMLAVVPEPSWLFAVDAGRIPGAGALLGRVVRGGRSLDALLLGLLLGFLPCGLSMAAFSRSLVSGSTLSGLAFSAAFGLGTLPAMLLVGWLGQRVTRKHRQVVVLLAGMVMLGMSVLQGLRAMRVLIA